MIILSVSIQSIAGQCDEIESFVARPALSAIIVSTDDENDQTYAMKIVSDARDAHGLSQVLTLVRVMIDEQLSDCAKQIANEKRTYN